MQKDTETLETIRRYHALAKKAPSYFRRWTLHRTGHEPRPFRHADTGRLIAKIYPYGTEARDVNAYAGLSPASAEAAVKLIMDSAENRRLGFGRDEILNSPAVRKIRKYVREAIAANGYCSLFDLQNFIQSPPFGLGNNGYSAAILSAALADETGLIYRDSVSDSYAKRSMYGVCLLILSEPTSRYSMMSTILKRMKPADGRERRWYLPCLYKEYPCHRTVREALAELYGVPDEWEGIGIVTRCRGKMEKMFRLPMSVTDNLLYTLTGPEICWYDRAEMERLAAEVTARKTDLPRVLAAHIEKDRRIPYRQWIPGAACWLWDRDTMFENPHCMMLPEEQARLEELHQIHYDCESRKSVAAADKNKSAWNDADRASLEATRAENDYLQDRLEPCKRRLLALCGNPNR